MNADDAYSELPDHQKQLIESSFAAMLDDEGDSRWLAYRDQAVSDWRRGQRALTGRDPLKTLCDA